jgi:sodium pump decarboxylase gamma subunit
MFDLVAFGQGGILMLVGMVVVFIFLVLLIVFINFTIFLGNKLGWGKSDDTDEDGDGAAGSGPVARDSGEVVAAISAATHHQSAG